MNRRWLVAPALCALTLIGTGACGGDGADTGSGGTAGGGTSGRGTGGGSASGGGDTGGAPLTNRPYDPVVLIGGELPGLASVIAGDVVAFSRKDGAWKQIPVQVDERVLVDFCQVYAKGVVSGLPACGTTEVVKALFYADDGTYTGADTDPHVDADDEVVLMARDAGARAAAGADEPEGAVAGSGVEVEITDGAEKAYAYLFARTKESGLDPAAGAKLVHYDFSLADGGDYKKDYPLKGGGNCGNATCNPPAAELEDSVVKTDRYERHFAARWVTDELRLTTEGSSGDDILDLAQAKFSPAFCGRHVLTFSTAEGAFVANVDGPLRAIRSYLGANSGPLTERTHLFYEGSEVVQTFLRVHEIPGVMDLVDYAPTATGMTYFNEKNTKGMPIDGMKDDFDPTPFAWDLVTGPHGSVLTRFNHWFSDAFHVSGYYEDDAHTPNPQCNQSDVIHAPDDQAFGTSGFWIDEDIPVTDPSKGGTAYVVLQREQLYGKANLKEADAAAAVARDAMKIVARRFGDPSAATCGDGTCDAGESSKTCPFDCAPFDGSCGDGLCDLWENSVTCAKDCADGQSPGGSKCGDGTCAADEQELSCPADCWTAAFVPVVACFEQSCPIELGTCSADPGCVKLVVCTGDCVTAHQGTQAACFDGCVTQVAPTGEEKAAGQQLLACGTTNHCN